MFNARFRRPASILLLALVLFGIFALLSKHLISPEIDSKEAKKSLASAPQIPSTGQNSSNADAAPAVAPTPATSPRAFNLGSADEKETAGLPSPLARDPSHFSADAAQPTTAQPTDSIMINDAGIPRQFEFALNEVWVSEINGKGKSVPANASTLAELESEIRALEKNTGIDVAPILYERDTQKNPFTRRVLTKSITVQFSPGEDPARIAADAGIADFTVPEYAPGHLILRAQDSFASLRVTADLENTPGIVSASPQLARQQSKKAMPNDPRINDQWHYKFNNQSGVVANTNINVESVWAYPTVGAGSRGRNIRIGIIDDGVDTAHEDFAGNIDTANDKDWNGNDNDPSPGSGDDHGTSCAGNAAARGNNGIGVSGSAPEAMIVGMRLIADVTTDTQDSQAMAYLPNLIEIKSNSWGPNDTGNVLEGPGSLTLAALKSAAETGRNNKGTLFFWAGGNGLGAKDNSNYDGYANSIYTIAVGAFDSQSRQAYYSEPGANLVITAPSNGTSPALGITTTDRTGSAGYVSGNYETDFGGTSSATPTAAGVAALMLEANSNLGWRDVQEILLKSARKVNPSDTDWITNSAGINHNHKFGGGLIDAAAAIALCPTWTNLGTHQNRSVTQSGLNVAIPNNNFTGITREFLVTPENNLRAEHVTLTLNINHTARGNLKITLESPTGFISRLAEVHTDSNDDFPNWTFMTVRNWGENSAGTWRLRISDESSSNNSTGGTLTSATLKIFGTSTTPINPPPSVTLTSPVNGTIVSPGTSVNLAATASDTATNGTPGTVTMVEFLSNNSVIHTDMTSPYSFNWSPSVGIYNVTARATDSEGAVSTSSPVTLEVRNQLPVITQANISPSPTAYSDEDLSITGLIASDPENDTITFSYQWQYSSNGSTYTDAPGQIAASLPASPTRSGVLWRCRITPSDTFGPGTAFTTSSVSVNTRPPQTAITGQPFSYDSDLFLRGTETLFANFAIINEFSQGPSGGNAEWVEILVLRPGSLRGWQLADAGGTTLTLADTAAWDNIPAGTIVVLYNGASKDPLLPADDATPGADASMVVSSSNVSLASGSWPSLSNSGDGIILRDANDAIIDQIGYGNNTSTLPNIGSVSGSNSANFRGNTEDGNNLPANWSIESSLVARSSKSTRALLPGVTFTAGTYSQDFNTTPGVSGTAYPNGWTSYNGSTEDAAMTVGTSASTAGGNYNYNSRIGILGSSSAFNTSSIVLALANTSGLTNLKISYDISKIREQDRSHDFNLEYSLTSATTGFVAVSGGTYSSGTIAEGTVTPYSLISLPVAVENQSSTVFLRWSYTPSSVPGSGSRDALALDNVIITSGGGGPTNTLSLSLNPTSFAENSGSNASTGTVTLTPAPLVNTVVTLSSSDTGELTVPASVTILANQTTATFAIDAIDDAQTDGNQSVNISATAGALSANASAIVTDNEAPLDGVTPTAGNGGDNTTFVSDLRSGLLNQPALFRLGAASQTPADLTINPTTGILSGLLTAAPGFYTIVIERTNSLNEISSQSFVLQVLADGDGYDLWIGGFNGLSDISKSGDPDNDGFSNMMEYFLDLQADIPNASPFTAESDGDTFSIIYRKSLNATGVTGTPQWKTSLGDAIPWSAANITDTFVSDHTTYQLRRASVSIEEGETTKFLRILVTAP